MAIVSCCSLCCMLLGMVYSCAYNGEGGREGGREREREEKEGERDFMFDRARLPHLVDYATSTHLCSIDPTLSVS